MLISRKLAHQVDNRLQMILYLVELHEEKRAVEAIHRLSAFLHAHVENEEDEQARSSRENSSQ